MNRETVIRAIGNSAGSRRLGKVLRGSIFNSGAWAALVAIGACSALPQAPAARAESTSLPCDPAVLAIDSKLIRGRTSADVIREYADWWSAGHLSFTTSTQPDIINMTEVIRAMQRFYPVELRDRGIGGTATFVLLVGVNGAIVQRRLILPSSEPQIDDAARNVLNIARFGPVLAPAGCRAVYLVQMPLEFRSQ